MKVVAVAGNFDPLHDGHIEHIREASGLGDFLVVITHNDYSVARFTKKHECLIPLWARKAMLQGILFVYGIPGIVVVTETLAGEEEPRSGDCSKALGLIKPDVFAKGGDRTPSNMPQEELDMCRRIGCEIVCGVGKKINSSTRIVRLLRSNATC